MDLAGKSGVGGWKKVVGGRGGVERRKEGVRVRVRLGVGGAIRNYCGTIDKRRLRGCTTEDSRRRFFVSVRSCLLSVPSSVSPSVPFYLASLWSSNLFLLSSLARTGKKDRLRPTDSSICNIRNRCSP